MPVWWNGRHAGFKTQCPQGVGVRLPRPVLTTRDREGGHLVWFIPRRSPVQLRLPLYAVLAQQVEATDLKPVQYGFESHERYARL
jgi:hypothetical protein